MHGDQWAVANSKPSFCNRRSLSKSLTSARKTAAMATWVSLIWQSGREKMAQATLFDLTLFRKWRARHMSQPQLMKDGYLDDVFDALDANRHEGSFCISMGGSRSLARTCITGSPSMNIDPASNLASRVIVLQTVD